MLLAAHLYLVVLLVLGFIVMINTVIKTRKETCISAFIFRVVAIGVMPLAIASILGAQLDLHLILTVISGSALFAGALPSHCTK